jgi:hypothetical protein
VSHINIGSNRTAEVAEEIANAVAVIFAAASENNIDQATIQVALERLDKAGAPGPTTVTGCSFSGGCH